MPRAIVSSLYRVDTSQLEAEPSGPLPMAVADLGARAAGLIAAFRVGNGRTFDLSGLHHELLELLLDGRLSPSSAAVVLHQVLAPIPIGDRASLALFLTHSIREDRLPRLSHATLLSLRRAISFEEADVTSHALQRLDDALAQRPSSLFWSGRVLVVGDRVSVCSVEAALAQLGSDSAKHIVVVVPEDEKATSREVLLEHLRLQVRFVDDTQAQTVCPFLTTGAVQLVAPAAAKPVFALEALGRVARLFKLLWAAPLRFGFQVSGR
jgi:hypothetical protein